MITRTIVAAIFGPLIILMAYLGGWWLLGMILLFAAIGSVEFVRVSPDCKSLPSLLMVPFTLGIILATALVDYTAAFFLLAGYFLISGMLLAIKNRPPAELFVQQTILFWGTAYLGMLYPFVYQIRDLSGSGDWLLFLFGTLWLSDSLAMWIGRAVGKRKLAPTVSPNKTVAGFVGGLFGGVAVAFILGYWLLSEVFLPLLIMAGVLMSLVGQLGDLVESLWKRSLGIKDSSAIIPGHGGILDRFDSLLFAAPFLFIYLKYIVYG